MDIEDIPEEASSVRKASFENVHHRFKVTKNNSGFRTDNIASELPEKYHIFVQTWGCAHNTSDSEYMAGILARYGYRVTLGGSTLAGVLPTHAPQKTECDCAGDSGNGDASQCAPVCACQTDSNGSQAQGSCGNISSVTTDKEAREKADLWLLNSCTVKGPAEDHFRNAVQAGLALGKRIVVAGCVPQGRPGSDYLKNISVIGVQQIDRVVDVVEETLRGNTVRFLDKKWAQKVPGREEESEEGGVRRRLAGAALDLPKIRRNPLIEILAVSTGCLNACTYCKTKHARGVLASYPIEQLLQRAKQAFDEGVKELWLTSEDLGAYGRDLDRRKAALACPSMADRFPTCLTLIDLLAGLLRIIPPGCMLRLGMTNPPYILQQLPEMVQVLSHPRVYAFLHIPVQSGSDPVLDMMRREYTVDEFSHVVDYLRSNVPPSPTFSIPETDKPACGSLTIATDIICGFPNETEVDFQATVDLVDRYHFPVLYINQFFARSGTPAAKMPRRATTAEVKQRTRRLHRLFHSYQPYADRVGGQVRVLVTEASHDQRYWVGHTKAYEQVLVEKDPEILGCIVLVKITECDKFYMRSEVLDRGPFDSLVPDLDPASQSPASITSNDPFDRLLPPLEVPKSDGVEEGKKLSRRPPASLGGVPPSGNGQKYGSDAQWLMKSIICLVVCYVAAKFCELNGYLRLFS